MIFQPSAKQFAVAIANAIEDRKIPADKDYKRVMIGDKPSNQEHFLYWPHFNLIATFRCTDDAKHFFVSRAEKIEQGSYLHKNLSEWKK